MGYAAEKNEKYILATGDTAVERLELQNNFFLKEAYAHLEKAKLSKGMIVWDIGCGVGAMTSYLAEAVGETGHVYALDISEAQLKTAEKRVKEYGFKNVTFIKGDINVLNNVLKQQADLIYIRFVLQHLDNPGEALNKLKKLLKKGGVVVCQDSIMSSVLNQGIKAVDDYINTVVALGKHKKVDYNIGHRLEEFFKKAMFDSVNIYYNQQQISAADFKKLILMGLSEWKNEAIEVKILTNDQVALWEKEIDAISTDDPHLMFLFAKQAHVLAWN